MWSLVGSAVGAIGSIFSGNSQHKKNLQMMREQNAFQKSEREASQEFQDQQRLASQEYQTAEREAQNKFSVDSYRDIYENYQSPEAMAKQYAAAGLNPRLAAEGSAGQAIASSGTSGGAPTSGAPQGHAISPPYQNMNSMAQGFGEIAGAMKSIAEAKKAGVETSRLEAFTDEELKKLKLGNIAQELQNSIDKEFKSKEAALRVRQAIQDLATGELAQEEMRKRIDILVHEGAIKKNEADHWLEQFNNSQENVKADTSAKIARAIYDESNAEFVQTRTDMYDLERQLMQSSIELNDSMRSVQDTIKTLNDLDYEIRSASSEEEKEAKKREYDKIAAESEVALGKAVDDLAHDPRSRGNQGARLINQLKRVRKAFFGD